jgi:hypothetical protein
MRREHFLLWVFAAALLDVTSGPTLSGENSSYEFVLAGKKCETGTWDQTLSCEYNVGTGLKLVIAGIGQPDTAVTFMKSSFEGDFYASFGLLHGCVIVHRGKKGVEHDDPMEPSGLADYAFVSPRNGKVYQKWDRCKAAW